MSLKNDDSRSTNPATPERRPTESQSAQSVAQDTDSSRTQSPNSPQPGSSPLEDRDHFAHLRSLNAWLRSDLSFTRHIYQGQPVYLAHDPVNFKNHRFTNADYLAVNEFRQDRTLGQVFDRLVKLGLLSDDDERSFFEFVTKLHSLNLLSLPVNSGEKLFEQFKKQRQSEFKSRWTSFLFIRIPLAKPDRFLSQTIHLFRWMFSPAFLFVWFLALMGAAAILVSQSHRFFEPLSGMLAARNLPFLWLSLIGLKVWHELGHGYVCKHFGGKVPEMGAMFLVGNPAAYVDTSSAWAFPSRRQRIAVMLGGMYFESIVAIIAVFVWAFSTNPFLASCAFQLFVMAGMMTILFNANPLMRYDGYFVLGELLGIQNLRTQAKTQLRSVWKRLFLGIKTPTTKSRRERLFLMLFAISATIYRQALILLIAFILAYRFPFFGLALATIHITSTLWKLAAEVYSYLLFHNETRPIRRRAALVAAGGTLSIIGLICFVPVPGGVVSKGVTGYEIEHHARVKTEGFLREIHCQVGDPIQAKMPLLSAENLEVRDAVVHADVSFQNARLVSQNSIGQSNPFELAKSQPKVKQKRLERHRQLKQENELTVRSRIDGSVAMILPRERLNQMLKVGDQAAIVVQGQPRLRTWLNEEQLKVVNTESPVQVRFVFAADQTLLGHVVDIQPAIQTQMNHLAVTQEGGESILVDPISKRPLENLYEVQIAIRCDSGKDLLTQIPYGSKVSIRFRRKSESLGQWSYRQINGFFQKVTTNE